METRNSHGLDQFCVSLEERPGQVILDLVGVNQSTVSFVTGLGHRLFSEDFVLDLDQCFGGGGGFYENQSDPDRVAKFLQMSLNFPDEQFDGIMVWDTLEYMSPSLLAIAVAHLRRMLRPGACLLAVFHTEERAQTVPAQTFRIQDRRTMGLVSRGQRPTQFFTNRTLEKLFQDFQSVKFFLARDHLREIIVRR